MALFYLQKFSQYLHARLNAACRIERPPFLDELGPSVRKDKIFNAHLSIVKDSFVKSFRDVAAIVRAVAVFLRCWASAHGHHGCFRAARTGEGERCGRVDFLLLAVSCASCPFENVLKTLEI